MFPDQGHMAVASLRLRSLRNTNAVREIVSFLLFNRLEPSDAVFVSLWPAIFNFYIGLNHLYTHIHKCIVYLHYITSTGAINSNHRPTEHEVSQISCML
jgi:hypothetical protein